MKECLLFLDIFKGLEFTFPLNLAVNIAKYMATDSTKLPNVAEFTNIKYTSFFFSY